MKNLFVLAALLASLPTLADFAKPKLPADLAKIIEKLDAECSGNDSGRVGTFDPKKFDSVKIMAALQKGDSESSCSQAYSHSREEGVAATLNALFGRGGGSEYDCVSEHLSKSEQSKLKKMITDPTNLGVFSREWDGEEGEGEYCTHASYDIYRADGVFISIVFDHTD